jgi:hypothetical protein
MQKDYVMKDDIVFFGYSVSASLSNIELVSLIFKLIQRVQIANLFCVAMEQTVCLLGHGKRFIPDVLIHKKQYTCQKNLQGNTGIEFIHNIWRL